jgi:cytochrome P450
MDTLPEYPFKRDARCPFDPSPQVTELRHERPVAKVKLWDGNEVWLFTRMDDVRAMLGDDRFSADSHHPNYPTWSAAVKQQKTTNASFLRKDKPVHTAERRLWQAFFTPANIAALRPAIQAIVDGAIDDMIAAGSPVDICRTLAPAVPAAVISKLLAVPEKDLDFVKAVGVTRTGIGEKPEAVHKALVDLHDYWIKRIDERLQNPGDDLISKLIIAEVKTGRVAREGLAAMANLVLLAGFGTTADMIASGILILLRNPESLQQIKDDPSTTPAVIDEMLRYTSIVQHGLARVALQDVEIGGVTVRAGEGVVAHLASANRDEAMYVEPDHFDTQRESRFHVAFGSGSHVCIGAPLARAELQIVFDTVFRRLPDLRLAVPFDAVKYRLDHTFFSVSELMVEW